MPDEGLFDGQDDAATALTAEEREDLIPSHIALRRELDEAEQANILDAEDWAWRRRGLTAEKILDPGFLTSLHRRMFAAVWRWAGRYRTTNKNIGVDAVEIHVQLLQMLDQCRYWVTEETFDADTTAAQFHHQLVKIHCFPNGNGRHARLATDLLLVSLGRERFTWGSAALETPASLVDDSEVRRRYIAALRAADDYDIAPLVAFVRS